MRIVARSLLASERLVPVATLNKVGQESILGITNYSFYQIFTSLSCRSGYLIDQWSVTSVHFPLAVIDYPLESKLLHLL
jgi:hypothetical protein